MPRVRARMVQRARLHARLDAGLHAVLTLLCAPAGWGKTTLLANWLDAKMADSRLTAAWLSLDDDDNDPVLLIRDLTAVLRSAVPGVGDATQILLEGPGPSQPRTLMTRLVNELLTSPREIILALDDYHMIRDEAAHAVVAFLLEHLPPQVHIVVLTREDPPLPLPRLRAQGRLCEIRASDLGFTADEAAAFLRDVMEIPVSFTDAAVLAARTEGWIAGLQLAALAMPVEDVPGFLATFGGSHRTVLDYLGTEVLARQPGPVRTFLLHTSILDRLSEPLCDAVLGDERPDGGAQAMLEAIEGGNLFLTPLDGDRRWYRYHQLFAEFLRVHLKQAGAAHVHELHRRACGWYEAHGLVDDAIRHALGALDHDHALRLIEQHGMTVFYFGERERILAWFRSLSAADRESHPQLSVIYAYALVATGQVSAAEAALGHAERHLGPDVADAMGRVVRGRIALLRALMTSIVGDRAQSVAMAREALGLLPLEAAASRAFAGVLAARAFRVTGDATAATEHAVAAAVEDAKTAGVPAPARMGLVLLARVHALQGRLHRARGVFAEAERLPGLLAWGVPTYCFGLGELLREWNDLDGADAAVARAIGLDIEAHVEAGVAVEGYVTLARIRQARGDAGGAMDALDRLVRLARRRDFPETIIARAAAARARLWLMQGNLPAAIRWAETSGFGEGDPASYAREFELLVLARVRTAQRRPGVLEILNRLLADAEDRARTGSAIEILIVRALAHQALGEMPESLQDLARALALGEPEGYVRAFVDEGAPMATALRRARTRGVAPEYAARLLDAFVASPVGQGRTEPAVPPRLLEGAVLDGHMSPLVEPLTAREREIVRLIAAGASNREIAERLFVAMATVKTHIASIFGKLGVKSRTQAAAKAKALDLD